MLAATESDLQIGVLLDDRCDGRACWGSGVLVDDGPSIAAAGEDHAIQVGQEIGSLGVTHGRQDQSQSDVPTTVLYPRPRGVVVRTIRVVVCGVSIEAGRLLGVHVQPAAQRRVDLHVWQQGDVLVDEARVALLVLVRLDGLHRGVDKDVVGVQVIYVVHPEYRGQLIEGR